MKEQHSRNAFYAVVSLFFLWALAHNLNPILIPHLKKACRLSDMQSALVDSSFYIAYFLMAIPAGFVIRKLGYRKTIVTGLFLFGIGAMLFYPAATMLSYAFFLTALFIVASGLTFLETAANPYVTILGEPETASRRLNFAQAFNGLGATLAAMFGGQFILSGHRIDDTSLKQMNAPDMEILLKAEASSVRIPYLCVALIVFAMMVVFLKLKLPDIRQHQQESSFSLRKLFANYYLIRSLVAQFFYVGAQVGIGSFFIRYTVQSTGMNDQESSVFLSVALFLFMAGRFAGSWFMRFFQPNKLLFTYSLICVFLLMPVIFEPNRLGLYSLMITEFFMSIMFPTIFSNGIKTLGEDARYGSSLLVMMIVGGAFMPLLMGAISDLSAIRFAFFIPMCSFLIIAIFAFQFIKKDSNENVLSGT